VKPRGCFFGTTGRHTGGSFVASTTLYAGVRTSRTVAGPMVTRNGITLSPLPSQMIRNFSGSVGFDWGYPGSAAKQLALALLLDLTGSKGVALEFYLALATEVVAAWRGECWELTGAELRDWLARKKVSAAIVAGETR
jgi:hypothetical protein